MSQRAIAFVEEWTETNIQAEPFIDESGNDGRPDEYARRCFAEAALAGISKSEIDEEYRDLPSHFASAIDASAQAEVDRLVAKDPF